LPPGSLALLPAGSWTDPGFFIDLSARLGQIFKFRHFVFPAIGITNLEKSGEFLRANADSLLIPPAPFNNVVPGGFIRYIGDRKHQSISAILRAAVTSSVLESAQPVFCAESRLALERLATEPDLHPLPALDMMVRNALMRCFFGITDADAIEKLDSLYGIADYLKLARIGRRRAGTALAALCSEVRALAHRGDGNGCQSFITELAVAHPDLLDDDEVIGNFVYMLHTGRLDAAGLMVWLVARLAEEPEWLARLARALEDDRESAMTPGGLADRMVRETLRLHQSEFLLRRTKNPIKWNGYQIPARWYVRICVQESHRDPDVFENPDVFDPDRFLKAPGRTRYLPFGMSPRFCPGEFLSRSLGVHLVAEMAAKYEVSVARPAPVEFSGFHWRPGAAMRIALARRQ
jgi:cytochrome P450